MSRSLYAMLHRRFGPTLSDSERCTRMEAKLNLERAQWQVAALSTDCKKNKYVNIIFANEIQIPVTFHIFINNY